jgi:phosphate transport system substrate-binding protein
LVERLAHAYSKLKPDVTVRVVSPPMGSNGAIRAALAGAIDLAVAGRPLTDAEKAQGGQDRELGRTALAFVTSKAPAPPGWSVDDLASIYAGKVTHWADGSPIRIVMRSQGESDTATLRSLSPAMNAAVDAAFARPGMLIAANDLDNIAMLEKTSGSLGMSSLSLLQPQAGPLHPIALQGKLPSLAAVREGTYPHLKVLYLVRGARLSETGRGFLEFMFSAAGAVVVERSGYLPARAGHPR